MKIIENKKIFGKISVFDVIIAILGIAVLIFAYRYLYSSSSISVGNAYFNTNFQIKMNNLPVGTNEYIKEGDLIYDNETNVYIGKVVKYEVQKYEKIVEDYENNAYVQSAVPDRETIVLTLETSVYDAKSDLITENNYYIKVGKELYLRGSAYAGSGYIIQIER